MKGQEITHTVTDEIDGPDEKPKGPTPFERRLNRPRTKNGIARARRHAKSMWGPRRKNDETAPVSFGMEKFIRSSRFGAGLTRGGFSPNILSGRDIVEVDGEKVAVIRPRGKDYSLDGLKVAELRDLAARRHIKGTINMKKAALVAAITKDRF